MPRYVIVAKKAGMYLITTAGYWPATNVTILPYTVQMSVRKNSAQYQADSTIVIAGAEKSVDISCSSLVWLNAGDWIDCPVYQNSGVNKPLNFATDNNQHWNNITITRVA